MSSPFPVLSCHHLTKRFGVAAAPAVDGVSFALKEGELLGLLGPSGCGKTTLLRLVAGFERPDSGEIVLAGQRVCGGGGTAPGGGKKGSQNNRESGHWTPPERRHVGVVFQDYALFPHLSVEENVAFGLQQLARRRQLPKAQVRSQAKEAIHLVGLGGMERRYPHELSGGQQQRVALARALAPRPPLVLLDEPFSNLDVQVRLYLRQEVRDILKNVGASGIFVTHDQEEALAIADKVAVMQAGQLLQLDTPEGIYHNPASRFIGEFVTQANFIPVIRRDHGWEWELGSLSPETFRALESALESALGAHGVMKTPAMASASRLGELMIAQEDLEIVPDAQGALRIQGRQFLGRHYQYALQLTSNRLLQVRTPADQRLAIGEQVRVEIRCDRLRFFPKGEAAPISIPHIREKSIV